MRYYIKKFPHAKNGAGSPFEANLSAQLLQSLIYTLHDELTPIPSLLRKDGCTRNKVPTITIKIQPFICGVFPPNMFIKMVLS